MIGLPENRAERRRKITSVTCLRSLQKGYFLGFESWEANVPGVRE